MDGRVRRMIITTAKMETRGNPWGLVFQTPTADLAQYIADVLVSDGATAYVCELAGRAAVVVDLATVSKVLGLRMAPVQLQARLELSKKQLYRFAVSGFVAAVIEASTAAMSGKKES